MSRRICRCPRGRDLASQVRRKCRYGWCTEFRCTTCRYYIGGWEPMWCKCDGAPRWLRHPGMDQLTPAAVKPGLPSGRRHRQRSRR